MRQAAFRRAFQRASDGVGRLILLSQVRQRQCAQIGAAFMLGVDRQSGIGDVETTAPLPLAAERHRQQVAVVGVLRIKPDGLLGGGDRLREVVALKQHPPQGEMAEVDIRCQADRGFCLGLGLVVLLLFAQA